MASANYITALREPTRKPIYKIEWMDKNEVVIDEIITDLIDGEMTASLENGVRRTCNLTLENSDGIYIPDPDGLIYVSKKFKLYSGLTLSDGTEEFVPQGIFNLGNPVVSSNFSEKIVKIEAYDNFSLLNGTLGGTLAEDYVHDSGSLLTDVVTSICSDAGIIKSPIIYPNSEVLPINLVEDISGTLGDMLLVLANMFAWVVFFDVDGRLRFEPPVDESLAGSTWDFLTTEVTYIGSDHNYDNLKIYNNVIVLGESFYGNSVRGQAQDTGLFSDTAIAKIGLKTLVIDDSNISRDEDAQAKAEYELKLAIQRYEYGDIRSIPIDVISEGDIITIEDESNGFNRDRYLVKQLNLPISFNGTQNIRAWKVRDVSFL